MILERGVQPTMLSFQLLSFLLVHALVCIATSGATSRCANQVHDSAIQTAQSLHFNLQRERTPPHKAKRGLGPFWGERLCNSGIEALWMLGGAWNLGRGGSHAAELAQSFSPRHICWTSPAPTPIKGFAKWQL